MTVRQLGLERIFDLPRVGFSQAVLAVFETPFEPPRPERQNFRSAVTMRCW
jgi:hypothetical protein